MDINFDYNNLTFNKISDTDMRNLGFLDFNDISWIYNESIPIMKHKKDKFSYSLNYFFELILNKDCSNYHMVIINDDTGNIFDYDYMLNHAPEFELVGYISNYLEHLFKKFEHYGLVTK